MLAACAHTGRPEATAGAKPEGPADVGKSLQACTQAGREKLAAEKAYMHAKGKYLTNTQAVSVKEIGATWKALSQACKRMGNLPQDHVLWNAAALNFVKAEAASVKANAAYFKAANAGEEIQTVAKRAQKADAAAQSASAQYHKTRKSISEQEVDASWIVWKKALETMALLSKGHGTWNAAVMGLLEAREGYFEAQEAHAKACP